MNDKQSEVLPLLGFFVVEDTEGGSGFIAALMVTDHRGYPLEFKATTPVKPTLVQRTLYGGQLDHYVAVELCGKTLVQQSSRKPRTILVPDILFLDIAEQAAVDMVAVWRAGETLKVETDERGLAYRGTITPSGSPFQPLVYEARFADSQTEQDTIAYLEQCATRFDLAEAFERMRAALSLLAREDARYA